MAGSSGACRCCLGRTTMFGGAASVDSTPRPMLVSIGTDADAAIRTVARAGRRKREHQGDHRDRANLRRMLDLMSEGPRRTIETRGVRVPDRQARQRRDQTERRRLHLRQPATE